MKSKYKEIAELCKELQQYKEFTKGVSNQTKKDGLNEGKGFSAAYVRSVIIAQKRTNDDVVASARNWLATEPEKMDQAIIKLHKELKKIPNFINGVMEQSKTDGLNDGEGYSYGHVRDVIIYQKYESPDLIDSALTFLNNKLQEKQKKQAEFEARLKGFHAKLAS